MPRTKKIILVEDDDILAKILYKELIEAEFEVILAEDGEKGLNKIKKEIPDLILLDLIIPKKDGFSVLAELKKSSKTKNIPVIILTVLGADNDVKKGFKLGADDYIVKTQYDVTEIIKKIKDFFNTQK